MSPALTIATYNINGVNHRLPHLLGWLGRARPDIVALQELKCVHDRFPTASLERAGYGSAWQGEGRWNGVAILARGAVPEVTRRRLPGDGADGQARYVEAAVRGLLVASLYAPNGNPRPGPKWDGKLAWLGRLVAHAQALRAAAIPVVLAGDYNIVPTDADMYPSRSWQENALVQPQPRAAFRALLDAGWADALRLAHPTGPAWTFWENRRGGWARDAGLRIDHLLLSPSLIGRLRAAGVDRACRAQDGASDHAPVWAMLADDETP